MNQQCNNHTHTPWNAPHPTCVGPLNGGGDAECEYDDELARKLYNSELRDPISELCSPDVIIRWPGACC